MGMNWKRHFVFLLSVAICYVPLFLTFNRGINYFDEGYILEGARRIVMGELPYRDFHFIYTPGTIYFLSLFLRLGGQYIIVERFAALCMSIIGITFLGLYINKLTKNTLLTFFTMFLYVLWGPTHINFVWPIMIVIPLVFLYLYLFHDSHFFLSGIVMGIILLCKHNFGAALIFSLICYFVVVKHSRFQIGAIFLGFMSMVMIFFLQLIATQSFIPFIADMNRYTIQEVLVRKSLSVPFPMQSIGKFFLYTFPGIISFILCMVLIIHKRNKILLFMPFTIFTIYLFGIFPTPDWPHLTPLISVTGILLVIFSIILGNRFRFINYIVLTIIIGAGIYSATIRNYYRWEAPLIKHTHCFSSGVMKYICIDEKNYAIITESLTNIKKETIKSSSIFAFYNNPIYYFLSQKNNPTRFIDFNLPVGQAEESRIINELQQKKVGIIITRFALPNNQSRLISKFIIKHYKPIKNTYEFTIWKYK